MFSALGVPYKDRAELATPVTLPAVSAKKKTIDTFDEYKPVLTIEPQTNSEETKKRFVDFFDVDLNGNVYLLDV